MQETTQIVSKVLVHEDDDTALSTLKQVCANNNLVGLRVCTGSSGIGLKDGSNEIDDILMSNVDLGAIFLAENPDKNGVSGVELCQQIHRVRPELPIFLRRETDSEDGLSQGCLEAIAGVYNLDNVGKLDQLINEYICSMYYPVELAKGIQDISEEVFGSIIKSSRVSCDLPYLVKDQIIFGELFSLIPLESEWCRGYMMLQTTEKEVIDIIRSGRTNIQSMHPDHRDTNAVLNELTNMIWGGIKSRYFSGGGPATEAYRTQVPIIINHAKNICPSVQPSPNYVLNMSCATRSTAIRVSRFTND
jgi:hypothetical protein